MYSWSGDTSDWHGSAGYKYGGGAAETREEAARREAATGPRTYDRGGAPDMQRADPTRSIRAKGKHPLIIAVDVTGSMARWPFEIFDRLPLLYNTLSQYRADLEISFMAIGDDSSDRWPLQVSSFADGFDLEEQLGALYGEGGGGDLPESYGLLAWYVANRVQAPEAESPFLIVFGDATMHPTVSRAAVQKVCGVDPGADVDARAAWRQVAASWNTWFLRRPTGRPGDDVDLQWQEVLGAKRVVRIEDEQRAVDCAMGIVAQAWGQLDDFETNLLARQPAETVKRVTSWIERYGVTALACPKCNAPVPADAFGRFRCGHCGATLEL